MKNVFFKTIAIIFTIGILFAFTGCGKGFELYSYAFKNNEPIPEKYWYNLAEQDISIPLNWVNTPVGTKSFALIMTQPHGSIQTIHWAVFNIPANYNDIAEGASGENMPAGSIELNNHSKKPGYYGPAPHRGGGLHECIFELYALNTDFIDGLNGFKSYEELNTILEGKVIAKAQIIGTATRK